MRTAVRWVSSLTSSARPGPSSPQQAQRSNAEAIQSAEAPFREESNGPAPHTSLAQESTVNPGTRLEASTAPLQTSSCPVVGQLLHEKRATLPTISEEGNCSDCQGPAEDLQGLSAVGNATSAEATSNGITPEQVQP